MPAGSEITLLTVKVSREELGWFKRVAEFQGMSLSELVRQNLAIEAVRLGVPGVVPASAV